VATLARALVAGGRDGLGRGGERLPAEDGRAERRRLLHRVPTCRRGAEPARDLIERDMVHRAFLSTRIRPSSVGASPSGRAPITLGVTSPAVAARSVGGQSRAGWSRRLPDPKVG